MEKNGEIDQLKESALQSEKIIDKLKLDIKRLEIKIAQRDATIKDQKNEIAQLWELINNLTAEKQKLQKELAEHDAKV